MATSQSKDVARFIAARLREMYPISTTKKKAPGEKSLDAIAKELGISKPQVYSALTTGKGIGPKVQERFAAKEYGGSWDRLRKAAAEWAKEHPADSAAEAVELAEAFRARLRRIDPAASSPASMRRLRAATEGILRLVESLPAEPTRRRPSKK